MEEIEGKIEDISTKVIDTRNGKKDIYSVKIEDNWYSGWGDCPYKKDEKVKFNFETVEKDNKTFRNIKVPKQSDLQLDKLSEELDKMAGEIAEIKGMLTELEKIEEVKALLNAVVNKIKIMHDELKEMHNYQIELVKMMGWLKALDLEAKKKKTKKLESPGYHHMPEPEIKGGMVTPTKPAPEEPPTPEPETITTDSKINTPEKAKEIADKKLSEVSETEKQSKGKQKGLESVFKEKEDRND